MPKPQRPVFEINQGRFDRRVIKTSGGCWTWDSTVQNGIPIFRMMDPGTRRYKNVSARRWIWEQQYGPLPKERMDQYRTIVVNVCGNKLCVMPSQDHNKTESARDHFMDRRTSGNKKFGDKSTTPSEEDFMKGGNGD